MIILVGTLPPPVYGSSLITERVKNRLINRHVPLQVCSTTPRPGSRGLIYFLSRAGAYVRSCQTLLERSRDREKRAVYLALSGRLGLVYDLVLVIVGRLARYNMIFHHHTFSYIANPSRFLRAIVKVAGRDQIHVTLCPTMARKLAETYGPQLRFEVISNLSFMDLPKPIAHASIRPLTTIGYLSNISLAKGIDRYLDLVALLRSKGSRVKGLIAGPFDDSKVRQFVVQRIQQIGNIDYVGAVYDERKATFFSKIDLLVFPSRLNEAQPLVIFEAQAAGVPVAATNVGCIADILGENSAMLFDLTAQTLEPLAERILQWEREPQRFCDIVRQTQLAFSALVDQCTAEAARFDTLTSVYR